MRRKGIRIKDMAELEIDAEELRQTLEGGEAPQLIDVREAWETEAAPFPGALPMPMGEVPARAFLELDPDRPVVAICHHGVRSLYVANWLREQGFEEARSLRAGIDGWSARIDPRVPRY
jgi:rhodanese-related sulfurtransferase